MSSKDKALLKLIEKLTKRVEELSKEIKDIKEKQAKAPVVTSRLSEEEYKEHILHSEGMQRAIDKILADWEIAKNKA